MQEIDGDRRDASTDEEEKPSGKHDDKVVCYSHILGEKIHDVFPV